MANGPLQKLQAAQVARRFYLDQQTKSQIADDMGLSRFKVARLLEAALEDGIVRIEISDVAGLNLELSEALAKRFNLREALVLETDKLSTQELIEPIGQLAADYLDHSLSDGQLLGLTWGRTLAATSRALTRLPRVDVVQTAGSPAGLDLSQNPTELVHRFAKAGGGAAYPMFGPMWVEDADLAGKLRREPGIVSATSLYDRIDVLVVGIGSWRPEESCLSAGVPDGWRRDAIKRNVVADLCATLIAAGGGVVESPLDQVGLCLQTNQLRAIPERIGIGGGAEKADAIRAVLDGGWITTLITDAGVARVIMQDAQMSA